MLGMIYQAALRRPGLRALNLILAFGLASAALASDAFAQDTRFESGLELVDPQILRVCADPSNLPFSNEKREGLENRIAELLALRLNKKLAYAWYPQATGFVRNTLSAHRCDLIMGFPQGDELVQSTNPYYRSAYALISMAAGDIGNVHKISDPRLAGKHIGIVAGTPPATYLALNGLMKNAKPYPLVVDTRVDSSAADMMRDLLSGTIDAGLLWGPMAGYYAKHATAPMNVNVVAKEEGGPPLAFRISMGVRLSDQGWKRQLNQFIAQEQGSINQILRNFGVPLIDDNDREIGEGGIAK
jgi:quinoprotein dehydrogenase-associated probable ABC transporter substrate-binding protein